MAIAKIKKIQLLATDAHKAKILEILQNSGVVDIQEIEEKAAYQNLDKLQKTELTYTKLEHIITLLADYGKKQGLFAAPIEMTIKEIEEKEKDFNYEELLEKSAKEEEIIAEAVNLIATSESEITLYKSWKKMEIKLQNIANTDTTAEKIGSVKTAFYNEMLDSLNKVSDLVSVEKINTDDQNTYFVLIFSKELVGEIQPILSENKFSETEMPNYEGKLSNYLGEQKENITKGKEKIKKAKSELTELAKSLDDMKIVYDYFGWQKEKLEAEKNFGETDHTFVLEAWVPTKHIDKLKEDLEKETKEYEISEIALKEGETPPVVIRNSNLMSPFEAVTKVYGLPKYTELDPTPFLAAFFILFFALCLTDAGYGIIMFIVMAVILRKFRLPPGIKLMVRLLMYGGIATFFIGALFGGWFGLTPDQVPESLTYIAENGEQLFLFQKINAISNPIFVLIMSLALGFIQILLGVTIKFVHNLQSGQIRQALTETGIWIVTLSGIGAFILASAVPALASFATIAKFWVFTGLGLIVIMPLFEHVLDLFGQKISVGKKIVNLLKGLVPKFVSGLLGLYGLVGYMGDILSYSRLLALGLATAIIGLAVNTVAALVGGIPYVGWLIMAGVFLGGHIFNLLINSLGSFIHSGRLQFVEFFTKFMEGGGKEFNAFSKKSKYVYIKNNN